MPTVQVAKGDGPPPDAYHAPEWLRYARAIYFEGYAPPIFPQVRDFDAKRLVALAQELGGDTLRFQPAGYRATYPSKVFPIIPGLGNRDLIEEVSRECRRAGMHLYCYSVLMNEMESAFADDPRFGIYALRDADGKAYGMNSGYGNAEVIKTCATGDPYRQMIRKLVAELCEHDIDGVYFDAPSGYRGICFCASCREGFQKFSGMDLMLLRNVRELMRPPRDTNITALNAWYDWANKLTEEDLVDLRKIIHGSGKFMLCHNGGTWRPGSFHSQYRYSDGFMVEYSEEFYQRLVRAMMGSAMARPTQKLAQTYMGGYDVATNAHPLHNHPWTPHVLNLEDGDEVRMEGYTDLAGGNMPLYCVVNRLLYGIGEGSTEPAKEVFSLVRRAEPILKDSVPVPYVTIVPTADSLEMFRARRRSWNVMMCEGMALTLLDARISFDVVPNLEMTKEWLQTQRVIALCGASAITDADSTLLADWVKEGGGLLATYDSGLYKENGELRQDGGALREILGVEMKSDAPDGQTDTFYRIIKTHPALGDYREGKIVMGDAMLVRVTVQPRTTALADCVNMETQEILGPAIVANQYGQGRTLYVGGSLEANYAASRIVSLRRMLVSMVRYLAGDAPVPFSLVAPQGVYGILRRAPGGDLALWICANVGFKDAAVGRMRQEFVPVSNVEVKIRVPEGKRVKSVHLIRSDRSSPVKVSDGYAVVNIPNLHIAKLIHLALA
jgi:Beta-galactosidase trimerisation domain